MQLAIKLAHHDHAYVERRGGWVLYSYMRQAPHRSRYRRHAIERAFRLYRSSLSTGEAGAVQGGLGLMVVQRAYLAAEDLARLLVALDEKPSWSRLTEAKLPDLDDVFSRVQNDRARTLRPFILPRHRSELEQEGFDALTCDGLMRLAELNSYRWLEQLDTVTRFWSRYRPIAKATMHGFPMIAGSVITGPPPAGALTDGLRVPAKAPWALALLSEADHQNYQVHTVRTPIELDESKAASALRAGKMAADLAATVSAAQVASIDGGYARTVPLDMTHRLPEELSAAVEATVRQRKSDDRKR